MRIIHTSDWHLGHRLYNYDRSDEETVFFRQLADLVGSERPDALVVCGDIFHAGAPGNDVAKNFTDRLLDVTSRCPEMETLVIAGNHDSYSRLVIDEALWRRCQVHVFGVPAEDDCGRADFAGNVVALPGKGVIAAVPFCHARNFPSVEGSAGENRARDYFEGLARHVASCADGLPTVLMAHLAVGKDTSFAGQDRQGVIGGEECVAQEMLGTGYDYVALGHIHCPQWIKGAKKTARYCGTPRAIHFDESYPHGVDVVEVEAGREPKVRTVEFEPLRRLATLGGEKGLPFDEALAEVASSTLPAGTYVRINVRRGPGELPGPDWSERSRQACAAKDLRFCMNNPIRTENPAKQEDAKTLTMAELKELSDDVVLDILTNRHELTDRQIELVRSLMKRGEE